MNLQSTSVAVVTIFIAIAVTFITHTLFPGLTDTVAAAATYSQGDYFIGWDPGTYLSGSTSTLTGVSNTGYITCTVDTSTVSGFTTTSASVCGESKFPAFLSVLPLLPLFSGLSTFGLVGTFALIKRSSNSSVSISTLAISIVVQNLMQIVLFIIFPLCVDGLIEAAKVEAQSSYGGSWVRNLYVILPLLGIVVPMTVASINLGVLDKCFPARDGNSWITG